MWVWMLKNSMSLGKMIIRYDIVYDCFRENVLLSCLWIKTDRTSMGG